MILHKLRENAIHLYTSKSYRINKPKFNIEQAICMPYNKEIDTLIRNHSMLDFFLCGVFDTKYNLNVGKKITSYIVNDIEKINWQDEFDTVILGHIKELSRLTNFDYYNYIYEKCKIYHKQLFQFDAIDENLNNDFIYSPNILNKNIPPLNYGKLFQIGKPVVAIMGTSSCQGKFTLQLKLREALKIKGYKVGNLGTEPQSHLFGFDETFLCGYDSNLEIDEQTSIGFINYLMHFIEMKNPDIILVGGQSGLLPYAMYNIRNNSPYQKDILQACHPDAIILCINYYDDFAYIKRTINYAQVLSESKVIALAMFPFNKTYSWSAVSSALKYVDITEQEEQQHRLEKQLKVKVFLQSQIEILCNEVIQYLSEKDQ